MCGFILIRNGGDFFCITDTPDGVDPADKFIGNSYYTLHISRGLLYTLPTNNFWDPRGQFVLHLPMNNFHVPEPSVNVDNLWILFL